MKYCTTWTHFKKQIWRSRVYKEEDQINFGGIVAEVYNIREEWYVDVYFAGISQHKCGFVSLMEAQQYAAGLLKENGFLMVDPKFITMT